MIFVIDTPSVALGANFGTLGLAADTIASGGGNVLQTAEQQVVLGLVQNVAKLFGGQQLSANDFINKMVIPLIVNPQSMSVTKNPKVSRSLTKKGLLIQSWQSEPDVINFSGRAASNKSFVILSQLDAVSKTLEDGSRNIVTMLYKFIPYTGYIENFKTAIDANISSVFDYTFDFQFVDKSHLRLFTLAIQDSTINNLINGEGTAAKRQLGLDANSLKNNKAF